MMASPRGSPRGNSKEKIQLTDNFHSVASVAGGLENNSLKVGGKDGAHDDVNTNVEIEGADEADCSMRGDDNINGVKGGELSATTTSATSAADTNSAKEELAHTLLFLSQSPSPQKKVKGTQKSEGELDNKSCEQGETKKSSSRKNEDSNISSHESDVGEEKEEGRDLQKFINFQCLTSSSTSSSSDKKAAVGDRDNKEVGKTRTKEATSRIIGNSLIEIQIYKPSPTSPLGIALKQNTTLNQVEVSKIVPNSIADCSPLKVGMVIDSVNGYRSNADDIVDGMLKEAPEGMITIIAKLNSTSVGVDCVLSSSFASANKAFNSIEESKTAVANDKGMTSIDTHAQKPEETDGIDEMVTSMHVEVLNTQQKSGETEKEAMALSPIKMEEDVSTPNQTNNAAIAIDATTSASANHDDEDTLLFEYSDTEVKKKGRRLLCQVKGCQKITRMDNGNLADFCMEHLQVWKVCGKPNRYPEESEDGNDSIQNEHQLEVKEEQEEENNNTDEVFEYSDTEHKQNKKGRGLCHAKGCQKCSQVDESCHRSSQLFCRGHLRKWKNCGKPSQHLGENEEKSEEEQGENDNNSAASEKGEDANEDQPVNIELSDTENKMKGYRHLCRAKGCKKCTKTHTEGFCTTHFHVWEARPKKDNDELDNGKAYSPGKQKKRGRPPMSSRKNRGHAADHELNEDSSEVEVVYSSPSKKQRRKARGSTQQDSSIRRSARESTPPARLSNITTVKDSSLRRSKRETTSPARLSNFPMISTAVDDEENDVEEEDTSALAEETKPPRHSQAPQSKDTVDAVLCSPGMKCKFENCQKYKQTRGYGYCMTHFNSLPPDEKTRATSSSRNSSGRGRKRNDELHSGGQATMKHTAQASGKKSQKHSNADTPLSAKKMHRMAHICTEEGCEKYHQSGCNHYCARHFREHTEKEKMEAMQIKDKTPASNKKKKPDNAKRDEATAIAATSESLRIQRSLIKEGTLVLVQERKVGRGVFYGGGLGKVTKIHLSADSDGKMSRKYDVSFVLGGQDLDVEECYVSLSSAKENDAKLEENADDISLSDFVLPSKSHSASAIRPRRRSGLGGNSNSSNATQWRCNQCGDLNSSSQSGGNRCVTCQHLQLGNTKDEIESLEMALLERTRYELLNGHDFWICTTCGIGVPSLTSPCGGCGQMISFVPLEIGEFEQFVRTQKQLERAKQTTADGAMQTWRATQEWQEKINELQDEWPDVDENEVRNDTVVPNMFIHSLFASHQCLLFSHSQQKKSGRRPPVTLDYYKKKSPHGGFFCNYTGCLATNELLCRGFCMKHLQIVLRGTDPVPYPLVLPEERNLIKDMIYLAFEQCVPCTFGPQDTTKVSFVREGYPGLACKHCKGDKDMSYNRWFPSSEDAMYASTFAKGIMKHMRACSHCPSGVRYFCFSSTY